MRTIRTSALFAMLAAAAAAMHPSKTVPMPNNYFFAASHEDRLGKAQLEAQRMSADELQPECGQYVLAYGRNRKLAALQENLPGAGMNPHGAVPFVKVFKDGFHFVDCVKDVMYEHGDKFGNNRFLYKLEDVANSSIVHYKDIVPKEDREKMTPTVCFEFCRGLEDMGFFGINNGRDCYCTSYYEAMASDSSDCDSLCEGEPSELCGGKTKNGIWSMHSCGIAGGSKSKKEREQEQQEELATKSAKYQKKIRQRQAKRKAAKCGRTKGRMEQNIEDGEAVHFYLYDMCRKIKGEAEVVANAAGNLKKHFGNLGDPDTSNLLQKAKVFSDYWIHEAEDCLELHVPELEDKRRAAEATKSDKFSMCDKRKLRNLHNVVEENGNLVDEIVASWAEAQPQTLAEIKYLPNELAQYYSVMSFIDKDFEDDSKFPVTCDGDLVGQPLLGARPEDCAVACNNNLQCVGFTALAQKGPERTGYVCFLFSKLTSAQYYTGCAGTNETQSFFQLRGSVQKHHTHDRFQVGGFLNRTIHAGKSKCKRQEDFEQRLQADTACQQKRSSSACAAARQATAEQAGYEPTDSCFLLADKAWIPAHLPQYVNCLTACCEDYDPELIFGGFTCGDMVNFQDCSAEVDAYLPRGSTVANICPVVCSDCETNAAEPIDVPRRPTIPEAIDAEDLTNAVIVDRELTPPKASVQAMCRAKFSEFSGISLEPDPSGASKFALRRLSKALRCVTD